MHIHTDSAWGGRGGGDTTPDQASCFKQLKILPRLMFFRRCLYRPLSFCAKLRLGSSISKPEHVFEKGLTRDYHPSSSSSSSYHHDYHWLWSSGRVGVQWNWIHPKAQTPSNRTPNPHKHRHSYGEDQLRTMTLARRQRRASTTLKAQTALKTRTKHPKLAKTSLNPKAPPKTR